jgi:short-subunit dehydrogenase
MQERCEQLKAKFPKIQTKTIVCDFSKVHLIEEYRKIFDEEIKDIDIGIVGLNAGIASEGPYAT